MSQKPSIGRIVLVTADPTTNNGSDVAAAVITRVWSDELVNVAVFLDAANGTKAQTSVSLFADRAALDAAKAERDAAQLPHAVGVTFTAAYWPPRV